MKIPIIIGVDGESKDIINEAGSGIAIEPENASSLAAAIIKLADSAALCQQYGEQGREYVTSHFDRCILAQRYEQNLCGLYQ